MALFLRAFLVCQVKDEKNKKPNATANSADGRKAKSSNVGAPPVANHIGARMMNGPIASHAPMPSFSTSIAAIPTPGMMPSPGMMSAPGMMPMAANMMPMNANLSMAPQQNMSFNRNCGSVMSNGLNSITERMERMKLGPHPVPEPSAPRKMTAPASSAELTTPTAIQINQAVNQLSSRPAFPNNFDLENIKLPPGITITKVDPATVQRKPIQVS